MENIDQKNQNNETPEEELPSSLYSQLNRGNLTQKQHSELTELGQELQKPELSFLKELQGTFGNNIDICLVGGIIRDKLLGKEAKDYDFVVSFDQQLYENPDDARQAFENFFEKNYPGRLRLVGENFGVYKFDAGEELGQIDIAFPRNEWALDNESRGGKSSFEVQSDPLMSVEEDLSRRDLNINAMALRVKNLEDPDSFEFLDSFEGIESLENREIKAVGNPEDRFNDDYSRIFRAIRFASKYDFDIEEETWQAIGKIATEDKINKKDEEGKFLLKRETIASELCKALYHNPGKTLDLITDTFAKNDEWQETSILKEIAPYLLEEVRLQGFNNQKKDRIKVETDQSALPVENRDWYIQTFGRPAGKEEITLEKVKKGRFYRDHFGAPKKYDPNNPPKIIDPPNQEELERSRQIKEKSLERAAKMFELAREQEIDLSLEETFAILFHNSGQTPRLAQKNPKTGKTNYPGHHRLSAAYWNKFYRNFHLFSIPENPPQYKADNCHAARIIHDIPKVYSILSGHNWEESQKPREDLLLKLFDLFPQGVNDPLLTVIKLDIEATENISPKTQESLGKLEKFLQEKYENLETDFGSLEEKLNELITPGKIHQEFFIPPGPLVNELQRVAKSEFAKYLFSLKNREEYSSEKAKNIIFTAIATHEKTRYEWRQMAGSSLLENFLGEELEKAGQTGREESIKALKDQFQKEVISLIEKSAYEKYMQTDSQNYPYENELRERLSHPEHFIAKQVKLLLFKDPQKLAEIIKQDTELQDKKIAPDFNKKKLVQEKPKNKTFKFFDAYLPEIANLVGKEQPENLHAEGDVFEHTFKALEAMNEFDESGQFQADLKTAAAVLLHDGEKPEKMDSTRRRTESLSSATRISKKKRFPMFCAH
ncbi:MAG: hypothetical protein U5L10_00735 [Candidatus Moranbacteria bacterium]|nr:hypothetical protein [Candidatus Moranbacteria bacterium]